MNNPEYPQRPLFDQDASSPQQANLFNGNAQAPVQQPAAPKQQPAHPQQAQAAQQAAPAQNNTPRQPVSQQQAQSIQQHQRPTSGQRISSFNPQPAAAKPAQPAAAKPVPAQQPAVNGATRVVAQSPAAPKGNQQTRINMPAAQANANAKTPADNGAGSGGGKNGNGGSGGNGGRPPRDSNGKPSGKAVAKHVFLNIAKFGLTAICIGIMIVAILGVQVASYVVESTANDDLVLDLNSIASSQTGALLALNKETGEYEEYYKIVGENNFIWVSYDEIPDNAIEALISTEDKTFYSHGGVNWGRTAYATLNEVFSFRSSFGASTVTQQLVKNLTGDSVQSDSETGATAGYMRKLREIFRAIGISNSYSKQMVLEAYFNTMPLSGTIIGIGAGAREYFNKTPAELELHEAAMIVGITNSPSRYNPYINPENCKIRRDYVLGEMLGDGKITQSEYDYAVAQPLGLYEGSTSTGTSEVTSWFADAALNQVRDDLYAKGIVDSLEAASSYLLNGGLQIETTVDLDIQAIAEDVYLHAYEEDSPFPASVYTDVDGETVHPQSAITIMDYQGNVVASVGGTGEKTASRILNRASMSPRQVGSTMKAIAAYPLGLEYNLITYSTNLMDSYCWFASGIPSYNADGTPNYDWPTNYGNSVTNTSISVNNAVARSTNTIAVRVGLAVGLEEMFDFAYNSMGLTYLDSSYDMGYSSLVLGGQYQGATTEQMAAAYSIYGNGGQYNGARYYTRVLDSQGNVIMKADNYTMQAVSEETAFIMNRLLYNVVNTSGGTANGIRVDGFETIGKTGTTSDDNDRWFVGMTPYYVGAIWWGYDGNYSIEHSASASTNGTTQPWLEIMNRIHEGLETQSFPEQPEGVVTATYCVDTGLLASESCTNRATGYYNADNMPDTCNGQHGEAEE